MLPGWHCHSGKLPDIKLTAQAVGIVLVAVGG
jgi:hypothetical protein